LFRNRQPIENAAIENAATVQLSEVSMFDQPLTESAAVAVAPILMPARTARAAADRTIPPAAPAADATSLRNWSARVSLADVLGVIDGAVTETSAAAPVYFSTRRIRPGTALVTPGQAFHSLYVVLSGALRVSMVDISGTEHVVAFPMTGDIVGFDAIADRCHPSAVNALDETTVAVLPYGDVQELRGTVPQFEEAVLRAFSAELRREHLAKSNMGSLGAEMRVVRFLLAMSDRFAALGYSPRRFRLRMTRDDIASYLGLSLETVCRSFTLLARLGLIEVCRRDIALLDQESLRALEFLRPSPGSRKPELPARSVNATH
jgi:CRP/FNR family transcriptional regulator